MKFYKTRKVKSPLRGTPQSAGIDFFIPDDFETVYLQPNHSILIPAGIKVRLPEGYALVANNKSGIASKKQLLVGAAVVDWDYMGEIHINLHNVGTEDQMLQAGDKIVQFLLEKQNYIIPEEVSSEEELFENMESERGEGGFGSTGTS
jgi:dUTP pyrophosphatase